MNAVVTGANRGLGLELVKQLCAKGDATSKVYALCRKTSEALTDLDATNEKVSIVEGIDVSNDAVTEKLQSFFGTDTPIDLLIHNAGTFGPPEKGLSDDASIYESQTLENITMDRMRYAFEVNTLGPLRVTQALLPNLKKASTVSNPAKVMIISSLMGSITDNTSGGIYGYRTAKAGANMVGMSLAQDLKKDDIAVGLIHPGFVLTGFGGTDGKDHPKEKRRPGQQDPEPSVKGILEAVDAITMENTGAFLHGNYGEGVKPLSW